MILVIGLGNPGKKYEKTRHNLGFLILDEFASKNDFPKFELKKDFSCLISKKILKRKKVLLAKPQTFMNASGKAAKLLLAKFRLSLKNLLIVHDDLDLPLGKIKISFDRGSGGHKGVQSIIDELGTKSFLRLRAGILGNNLKNKKTDFFVLENFTKKEKNGLQEAIRNGTQAILTMLIRGPEKAMNDFNK